METAQKKMKIEDSIPTKIARILVGVDGSEFAEKAAAMAIDIAKRYSSSLLLFHVAWYPPNKIGATIVDSISVGEPLPDPMADKKKQHAIESMHRIAALARKMSVPTDEQIIDTSSSKVKIISDYAYQKDMDLIVVGSRGLNEFEASITESVSQGLVFHAPCTVLVVK